MNKFSYVFNESKRYDFVLTDYQLNIYKKFINQLLFKLYSEMAVNISDVAGENLIVYKAYDYEKQQIPGRIYSILGKVNTNRLLISKIWEKFKIRDFDHLKSSIEEMSHDLFDEGGMYFKSNPGTFSVWDTIRFTEIKGEENEDRVCSFINKFYGPTSTPQREVTSSYKDMILGIDITFNLDGIVKTCQVKPMKFVNFKERGVVIIYSSGIIKNYRTDFMAFINSSKGEILFFENKGMNCDSDKGTFTLPYESLVNKRYFNT